MGGFSKLFSTNGDERPDSVKEKTPVPYSFELAVFLFTFFLL